jgi:hypothetical protein
VRRNFFISALTALCLLAPAARGQEIDTASAPRNALVQDWGTRHEAYSRIGPYASILFDQHDLRAIQSWNVANGQDRPQGELDRESDNDAATTKMEREWSSSLGAGNEPVHLVTDWSHRHVLFSPPHNLMDQFKLSRNTRYIQQWIRRNAERKDNGDSWGRDHSPDLTPTLQGDWSINMGTGAKVGAGNYPAKFSFNAGTASCSDFVVFNTSLPGSLTQATVVAFNNLYVGTGGLCGTAPSTYWAFNTGGTVVTSVALSLDGSQVAFIQNNSAGTLATLVILRWASGFGTPGSPDTLTAVSNAAYPTCIAPCMTTINFSLANSGSTSDDALSSPFYDYDHDTIYAGDSFGFLHKFTNVFNGTTSTPPAETISSTTAIIWPCSVSNNSPLTDPVLDPVSGNIFVGSLFGTLKRVDSTIGGGTGGILKTNQISTTGDNFDGPLLDVTNGLVYLIVSDSVANPGQTGGVSALYTFTTTFAAFANGVQTILSSDGPGTNVYSGAFDERWFLGHPGNMYVCAPGAGSNVPTLYQIAVSATGVLGTVNTGPALATAATGPPLCSPVTEFFNSSNTTGGTHPTGTDLIFLSVTALAQTAAPVSCLSNNGCLMSFDVTSGAAITTSTATAATTPEKGGTSGVIVDGSSTSIGASQIYFTPLLNQPCGTSGTGGCANQASQSGLN